MQQLIIVDQNQFCYRKMKYFRVTTTIMFLVRIWTKVWQAFLYDMVTIKVIHKMHKVWSLGRNNECYLLPRLNSLYQFLYCPCPEKDHNHQITTNHFNAVSSNKGVYIAMEASYHTCSTMCYFVQTQWVTFSNQHLWQITEQIYVRIIRLLIVRVT
jgi:hypothetical protein